MHTHFGAWPTYFSSGGKCSRRDAITNSTRSLDQVCEYEVLYEEGSALQLKDTVAPQGHRPTRTVIRMELVGS